MTNKETRHLLKAKQDALNQHQRLVKELQEEINALKEELYCTPCEHLNWVLAVDIKNGFAHAECKVCKKDIVDIEEIKTMVGAIDPTSLIPF